MGGSGMVSTSAGEGGDGSLTFVDCQILVVVEVIVVQKGVDHGVGRHGDTLSTEAIQTASKVIHTTYLSYILLFDS